MYYGLVLVFNDFKSIVISRHGHRRVYIPFLQFGSLVTDPA
jgi:hypothetical protein